MGQENEQVRHVLSDLYLSHTLNLAHLPMRLTLKRCHTCRALGVGPRAVRLWPFEGRMYCASDYRDALTWGESRGNVVRGTENLYNYQQDAIKHMRKSGYIEFAMLKPKQNWRAYITECSVMAAMALEYDDRRTFVYYFSRAVWAWALKENA